METFHILIRCYQASQPGFVFYLLGGFAHSSGFHSIQKNLRLGITNCLAAVLPRQQGAALAVCLPGAPSQSAHIPFSSPRPPCPCGGRGVLLAIT